MPTHFSDDPPQVINQNDLHVANSRLQQNLDGSTDHSGDERTHNANGAGLEKLGTYDKYEITEDDCYDELGYSFPKWKKWYILTVIFWVSLLKPWCFGSWLMTHRSKYP